MTSILWVDPFLPMHDRNSGSLRLYRILQLLEQDGHEVSFLAHNSGGQAQYADDLRHHGIQVLGPPNSAHTEDTLLEALTGEHFDTIVISFHNIAAIYMPYLRLICPDARIIIDTLDLHFVRERRQAALTQDPSLLKKAELTHTAEIASYAQADALIAISEVERSILLEELPDAQVYVVPNVHEVSDDTPGHSDRQGLVFVGNFWHPPNGEGIVWFCREVWPLIVSRIPNMTVDIVGQDPPAELARFLSSQVRVHGWVQSVEPFLKTSRLSIAPLLHGAGLKGKVGEALAVGLPVVTTSIGAEGLGLSNGDSAMVADGAVAFADAIVLAHQSENLWNRLANNGRQVIRNSYTPEAVQKALRIIVPAQNDGAVNYFGVPDWTDGDRIEAVLRGYIERHNGATNTTLHLGIIDFEVNTAFHLISIAIANLGYDPERIPDVTLTTLTGPDLSFLKPGTIWVAMRAGLSRPAHLSKDAGFPSYQGAS